MPFLFRVTDSISLRPPSARIHIIFFENGDFVAVLAFRPRNLKRDGIGVGKIGTFPFSFTTPLMTPSLTI